MPKYKVAIVATKGLEWYEGITVDAPDSTTAKNKAIDNFKFDESEAIDTQSIQVAYWEEIEE